MGWRFQVWLMSRINGSDAHCGEVRELECSVRDRDTPLKATHLS